MKLFSIASVILTAFTVTACGNSIIPADSTTRGAGSPTVKAFVTAARQDFLSLCSKYTVACDNTYLSVTIVDGDIDSDPNMLGVCYTSTGLDYTGKVQTLKAIKLRLDQVADMNVNATALVYHELAHCLAGAEHFDTELDIMGTFASDFAKEDFSVLVDTLFQRLSK